MMQASDKLELLKKIIKALDNNNRLKILNLCRTKEYNISELKRKLSSSNKVTYHNVKQLENCGLVTLRKEKHQKNSPVYVKTKYYFKEVMDCILIGKKLVEESK